MRRDHAVALYRQHDLAAATVELGLAVDLCGEEPFFKFMLGNALYRQSKFGEAAAMYRAFLDRRPSHFEAHMCLGFSLFELGDRQAAMQQWWAAAGLEPQSPFARAALAMGYATDSDTPAATVQYERAVALDPRYGDPDKLAIDIRWKDRYLAVLKKLQRQIPPRGDR